MMNNYLFVFLFVALSWWIIFKRKREKRKQLEVPGRAAKGN